MFHTPANSSRYFIMVSKRELKGLYDTSENKDRQRCHLQECSKDEVVHESRDDSTQNRDRHGKGNHNEGTVQSNQGSTQVNQ